MNILKKITLNTFIASGARMIDTILALILVALLTRSLGKTGYGYYATIVAYINVFTALANLGLFNILLKDLGRYNEKKQSEIASNIFTLRSLSLIIILPFSVLIAFFLDYAPVVKLGIIIASLATFFLSLSQVLVPVFQKHLKIIYVSAANLVNRLIYLSLVALIVFKFNHNIILIVGAMAIASLVNFLLVFRSANLFVKIHLSFNWPKWKRILKEALPVGASIIFTLIYFRIDTLMLSLMKPAQDVGIYNLSYKILESLIFFPSMFVGFIVPILSQYYPKQKEKFKRVFQMGFDVLIIALVPLVTSLILLARPIIELIASKSFDPSANVLKILSVAIGLIFLGNLYGQTVIVLGKQFWSMWVYLGGAVFNILANLYFIPHYSYIGAGITTVMTELLITAFLILIVARTLHYAPKIKSFFKALIATTPVAIFLYAAASFNILILITVSVIIYAVFIYTIKGLSSKDLRLLSKNLKS